MPALQVPLPPSLSPPGQQLLPAAKVTMPFGVDASPGSRQQRSCQSRSDTWLSVGIHIFLVDMCAGVHSKYLGLLG